MMQAALLTAVAYFICYAGNWMFGQCMTERPIVVGPIVGLFLGDPVTGLMLGATLEAVYMGAVNIGGSISSEPATATAFAVAFAVTSGISQDAAVALAIPIGVVAAFVFMFLNNVAFNIWVPLIDKFAAEGSAKKLFALNYFTWFLRFFILAVIMFFGVYLGSGVVQAFVDNIPDVVMRGLKAAGGLEARRWPGHPDEDALEQGARGLLPARLRPGHLHGHPARCPCRPGRHRHRDHRPA